jgi:3-deoxy-D-manno-octulosonate 8-phosphate phosphatase (KDO 8-P phosphatase)
LLALGGIIPVVITGRDSPAVRRRVADLGLEHAAYGVQNKRAVADAMRLQLGLEWTQCAAIGDDWPDLPLLQACAFAAAPPQAHEEVRACAHHVTQAAGGEGAVREFCDLLLLASGRYDGLLAAQRGTLDGR